MSELEILFPSDVELNVANALLHLSSSCTSKLIRNNNAVVVELLPPSSSEKKREAEITTKVRRMEDTVKEKEMETEMEMSIETTPPSDYLSSLTVEYSVVRTPCRFMHLKVAKRARSKVVYIGSGDQKPAKPSWSKPPKPVTSSEAATVEGSCLTTGCTTEISSGRQKRSGEVEQKRKRSGEVEQKRRRSRVAEQKNRRRNIEQTHIGRSAKAIIGMLSGGECASEVRIRQVLGDSPTTSKALRMLLRMEEVKRSGAGGRGDPFIYKIAATAV